MSLLQRARMLGLLAVVGCLVILSGCGASSGGGRTQITTPSGPYDTAQNVAAYKTAITGFEVGQNKVQALLFPVLTSSNQNFNDFMTNILPNISGVSVSMSWNQIETSQGHYDFSGFDASLAPYLGKQVNLIVWPATEGGNNDPNNGGSTPAYVFTQAWASDPSVNAPNPQDMSVCGSYTGDASNPFANSGGAGAWNVSSNVTNAGDLSGLPVSYEAPFMVAYQHFIVKVIQHYNTPGGSVPKIGYIRFGFSQGGENSPECNQDWPAPDGTPLSYTKAAYLSYIQTMTNFVNAQSPSMTIQQDLHAVGVPPPDEGYADAEASYAAPFGFGIGTNGLQQSDLTSATCDSDWCALFTQSPYSTLPIRSLQTLQWSDPTGQLQTGSLTVLIPFAQAHGANNLELYLADVALAYSPNYCNYPHAVCGP
jgi:hypothetical protein